MIVSTTHDRTDDKNPGALKPSLAKTPYDEQILPGGRKLGAVRDLASVLISAGVSGVSHEQGRQMNAAAYAAHVAGIFDEAGKAAVAAWLAGKDAA